MKKKMVKIALPKDGEENLDKYRVRVIQGDGYKFTRYSTASELGDPSKWSNGYHLKSEKTDSVGKKMWVTFKIIGLPKKK